MKWQPINEYYAEYHTVVVWLAWAAYSSSSKTLAPEGTWVSAYRLPLNDGQAVWVEAKDCIPIETTNRRVTHFLRPCSPSSEPV